MIEAYIDECGINQEHRICVVGGYFAEQGVWRAFENRWNEVLERYGTRKRGFHSYEFWNRDDSGRRKKHYAVWTEQRAEDYLNELVMCIQNHEIFPVATGLVVREWQRLDVNSRRWLTGGNFTGRKWTRPGAPNRHYFLPFQMCIFDVPKRVPSQTVHYFFGVDKKTAAGHALEMYRSFLTMPELACRHQLGNIDFPLSRNTPGLQAADLLVFRFHKHQKSRLGKDAHGIPELIQRLTSREQSKQRYKLLRSTDLDEMIRISRDKGDCKT
jgi:hypothetical protein